MLYEFLKSVAIGPALKVAFRPWVEGVENVPEEGAAILVSNHLSFSDSVFLPLVLDRRITFPAKAEYFTGHGLKGRLTALFFRGVGQVPMDRSGGKASQRALDRAKVLLEQGELFGYYPEGTRSPDGRLYKGKTGVARLALATGAPVIPVAMIDTEKLQPPGRAMPHLFRPGVRIGKPMNFSRYEGMSDRFILRSVTDEIMYAIMQLSGQEYVDVYAQKAKAELAASAKAGPGGLGGRSGRGESRSRRTLRSAKRHIPIVRGERPWDTLLDRFRGPKRRLTAVPRPGGPDDATPTRRGRRSGGDDAGRAVRELDPRYGWAGRVAHGVRKAS